MSRSTITSSAVDARPLLPPKASRVLDTDVGAVIGALTLVVVGLWARHGGVTSLGGSATDVFTSLASLTGLLTSEAGILGLILVTRTPQLERRYGLDRMLNWHRLLGELMAVLLVAHIITSVEAWADPSGVVAAIKDLTGRQPYMALTTVGTVMILLVTLSSLKVFRSRLTYETWYFVHMLSYVGLAFSFSHQIVLGSDFMNDTLARWFWIALHLGLTAWIVWGRWGTLLVSLARPMRVASIRREASGVVSLTLAGEGLNRHRAQSGQFYYLRELAPGRWWSNNPFSLSAEPTTAGLRFTIKDRGDASRAFTRIAEGARVAIEGPYGVCTPDLVESEKVVLVAGGVGIGPVVSFIEQLGAISEPVVLYRAHSQNEVAHEEELERLVSARGGRLHILVGARSTLKVADPFAADVLCKTIPDIADRTVVVAGPESMIKAVQRGVRAAGVPAERIHAERAWW
jgi:predicted ferric reductase